MRKRSIILSSFMAFAGIAVGSMLMTGCTSHKDTTDYVKYAVYTSAIQKEDCYLCGNNPNSPITPYLGESNIGLINLNTFDFVRFEVNRYDESNELIEKLVKYGISRGWRGDKDTGSTFDYNVCCNKGYASAGVHFNNNSDLQLNSIQTLLCSDCLEAVMKEYQSNERHWDIALIDFENGEVKPLIKSAAGRYLSDYYVSMHYNTEYDSLYLFAVYCPNRYSEYDYNPDLSVTDEIMLYCDKNNFAFDLNDEVIEFLSGFEEIAGLSYNNESVTFRNEILMGTKELTINKDGTYEIRDFDLLRGDNKGDTDDKRGLSK